MYLPAVTAKSRAHLYCRTQQVELGSVQVNSRFSYLQGTENPCWVRFMLTTYCNRSTSNSKRQQSACIFKHRHNTASSSYIRWMKSSKVNIGRQEVNITMDPFTKSTGFLSLTIELVNILTEYTNSVKPVQNDAQKLLTEVASFNSVLEQLTDFLKKPEHNLKFRETSILYSVMTICDVRIKNLHSKLDKFQSIGKTQGQWRWPLTKQECLDIVQALHHCAETIQLSFSISNGYSNLMHLHSFILSK